MKRYKVVISNQARHMLREHVHFLALADAVAARRLYQKIIGELRGLAQMPERYPYWDIENQRSNYRKLFIPNWYLALYVVVDDTVFVEYIIDGRQDYSWLLS